MSDDLPSDQRRPGFPFLPILLAGAGSALAAVLLSGLGLVGTVIGAALTPIIIITVQELGQRPVERVAAVSRVARDGVVQGPVTRLRLWERIRWRRVLVLAGAAFAVTVAAFTAVELLLDRPVATERPRGILGTRPSSDPPRAPATSDEPAEEEGSAPPTTAGTGTAPPTTAETDGGTTATDPVDGTTTEPDGTTGTTTQPAGTAPEETATGETAPVGPAATTETTATTGTTP